MSEVNEQHLDAAYDAFIDAIESDIAGKKIYPDGSVFIDAELEGAGGAIARAAAEGKTVVLCTQDGQRQVLVPSHPAAA